MSDRIRKRWKTIGAVVAIISPLGWAGEHTYTHFTEHYRLKNDLTVKVREQGEEIERVKAVQDKHAAVIEAIPVMNEKLGIVAEQGKANGLKMDNVAERLSRMEGTLDALKREKTVAVNP